MSNNQNNQAESREQQFTIQPHPATTNNPADLVNQVAGGNANVFNTPGVQSLGPEITSRLEQPKSREELQKLTEQLNQQK